ncbi:cytochrome c oxidase subunit II [Croceibacterium salegens]|nr:cytochrome c oxidase subunit II [Croceibacterium salegens]
MSLSTVSQGALAATAEATPAATTVAAAPAAADSTAVAPAEAPAADSGYTPLGPDMIKGQPHDGGWDVQKQYSIIGDTAEPLHVGLIWVMAVISVFVLGLLLYVMVRFRKSANPVPSKTSHNTLIEIIWTIVPVLILVVIAVPSIILLRDQYQAPPKDALTVKVTGYQWYWGYTYPDNGDFEVISNMMPEEEAKAKGFPGHLEVDHRMVVPAGEWIRIQTTGADVIHSFAVPSLWFKLDSVPGRLNEKKVFIKEPGIYYGQCSELCGARHGYMPIAVEALPRPQFEAWVRSQGGTVKGDAAAAPAPAEAAPAEAAPAEGDSAPGEAAPTA